MGFSPYWLNRTANGASRATAGSFTNGSGSTLAKGVPVSINGSSLSVPLDVSSESSILAMVGITNISTPNAASGSVIDNGRVEDITTSFAVGDPVYAGKSSPLVNIKPDIGVDSFASGDFVVFLGVIVKNEFNPLLMDLKLMITVFGQL